MRAVLVLRVQNRRVTLYFALSVYTHAVLKGSRVAGSGILKIQELHVHSSREGIGRVALVQSSINHFLSV